jgi:multidrug resistance efflux pump
VKLYGYEDELVQAAILHDIFAKADSFKALPAFGTYVKKGEDTFFIMDLAGENKTMEFYVKGKIEEDQIAKMNDGYAVQYVINALDRKTNQRYFHLVVSVGDSKEETENNMSKRLVQTFIKVNKINSKMKLDPLIAQYYQS